MAPSKSAGSTSDERGDEGPGRPVPVFADVDETLAAMQAIVGRKWFPIIVYHLHEDGPAGFSALKSDIDGVSSKVLSESLEDLQTAGLVTRELVSDQPVRVAYDLTERGRALEPLVTEMVRWGVEHAGEAIDP